MMHITFNLHRMYPSVAEWMKGTWELHWPAAAVARDRGKKVERKQTSRIVGTA